MPENDCYSIDNMRKLIIPFLIGLIILVSCKKEAVPAPDRLIEKDKMVDIMYDLALLGAMRNQNPVLMDSFKQAPDKYIFNKYKIDSAQFAQSNIYYAADFKDYKKMYEQVKTRLDNDKKTTEALIASEKKKKDLLEKKNRALKAKREKDSIKKAKYKALKTADSIKKNS